MLTSTRQILLAAFGNLLKGPSLLQTLFVIWISPLIPRHIYRRDTIATLLLEDYVVEVEHAFGPPTKSGSLLDLSSGFQRQLTEAMISNPTCMLPSYNHQLPSGKERGRFLALDVGGSTLRIAMIELRGEGEESAAIVRRKAWKIDHVARNLRGMEFFDWMAEKIEEVVLLEEENRDAESILAMGMSWSFPIEQTSLRSGLLLEMGKGFLAAQGLLGQDLGDLLQEACKRRGLGVELHAIVNDSSATLLSKAYTDPSTRFALILGTGVNAAVHLPVNMFGPKKFGVRPTSWHEEAQHVLVNTELSMFGSGVLPLTRWDMSIKDVHPTPDFQPLEYMVGGGYIGEIVRQIVVEGIATAGLLGGIIPPSLKVPYSLETETVSRIEGDCSSNLENARQIFVSRHPSTVSPSHQDLLALRQISSCVSRRASAFLAASCHALWVLRNEAEGSKAETAAHTAISYNGSVLEHYPNFREDCQTFLDALVEASGGKSGALELTPAMESSLVGAAVAVACLDGGDS